MYRRIPKNHKYLYHYTSPSTFIEYIKCSSLRFNFFSKVNDPKECKYWSASLRKDEIDKYIFDFNCPNKNKNILLYSEFNDNKVEPFNQMKNKIQLLCFTTDKYNYTGSDRDNAYLYRGFGNPYFWSHYGSAKHDRSMQEGVCIQLYLDEVENKFKNFTADHKFRLRNVTYSDDIFEGNPEFLSFDDLVKYDTFPLVKKCIFDNQDHYLFTKTKFWEAEKEYRLVIYSDKENYKFLNIKDCIASLIIGEDISKEDEKSILKIGEENKITVSKLSWGNAYPTATVISNYTTNYDYD
jgi:hypothetical protein